MPNNQSGGQSPLLRLEKMIKKTENNINKKMKPQMLKKKQI